MWIFPYIYIYIYIYIFKITYFWCLIPFKIDPKKKPKVGSKHQNKHKRLGPKKQLRDVVSSFNKF
jgi:hypothetical protein